MKNGKKAALAAGMAAAFLVACGSRADEAVVSGEMAVPEMSSEDLLVSSLEYLLEDDTEEQQDSQNQDDVKSDVQDTGNTADGEETEKAADPEQEPDEEQGENAVIYYGNGGSSELKEENIVLQEKTADELINALAKHNIVSLDTKVLSFEEKEENGSKVLYLDLSKAAGEYLRTMSKEAECIIVASVTNTFVANYDAEAVYLMVEGEPLTTSNRAYPEALKRCTPEELLQISGESDVTGSQEQDAPDSEEDPADSEEGSAEAVQSKLPLIQEKE